LELEAVTVADHPLMGLGYIEPSSMYPMSRLADSRTTIESVTVAEEVPIAFVYNGRPYVVVMGTPSDLEDLAVGFTLTEGVVGSERGIQRVEVVRASHGIEIQIEIASTDAARLEERARGIVSRTGCGLCGIESINDVLRMPGPVGHTLDISREAMWAALDALSQRQTLNNETNTAHAAGWATPDGVLHVVREDVGRHNALDKVLGALARNERSAAGGFIIITSRASYEMVQKAALRGIELVAAISRPTGLAIRLARASGVTLVGLLRGRTANVHCHPERIS
jgi:formate dehydrogenase accessory protein FdhD